MDLKDLACVQGDYRTGSFSDFYIFARDPEHGEHR